MGLKLDIGPPMRHVQQQSLLARSINALTLAASLSAERAAGNRERDLRSVTNFGLRTGVSR